MQNYIYFDPTKYLKNFEQYWEEREHAREQLQKCCEHEQAST